MDDLKLSKSNFCRDWLKAWTGNKPEELIKWYSKDAYYQDPAHPKGIKGVKILLTYFKNLLQFNPEWVWTLIELYGTPKGFVFKWKAQIPVKGSIHTEFGMDIVELNEDYTKIIRNEVYFDRMRWLELIKKELN